MEKSNKIYIVWAIRILSAALFILSAVGKLSVDSVFDKPGFAIYNFERNFLTEGFGIGASLAQFLSRLLIAAEFSIALLLLLPFYVKKIVIPGTIALLGAFSIHLAYQAIGGDTSNCGCFGSLIEMTPLESLFKNLISIALLVLLITKFKKDWEDKPNFIPLAGVAVVFTIIMFVMLPLKDFGTTTTESTINEEGQYESGYAEYFEDIDSGGKLLCFFSPTCEHCQETGKILTELKAENPDFPELRILFMDEAGDGSAADIKTYFDFVGAEYEYKVLSIEEFLPIFWTEYNFPGVMYLKNGEQKLFFNGTEEEEFKAEKLLEELKK
jgi:uncharacterized membrane protein YphA (DoxX/SURF4 family)